MGFADFYFFLFLTVIGQLHLNKSKYSSTKNPGLHMRLGEIYRFSEKYD